MPLTDAAIRNAKPREKAYKMGDGGGLFLHVRPNGSKLWRLKYRFASREKLLALGTYPAITLAAAREMREAARNLVEVGTDPAVQKKLDRIAAEKAASNTFGLIAQEVLDNLEATGAAKSTIDKNRWFLMVLARPLARRPIADISPAEVLDLLKKIEKSGRRETARRLRAAIARVFRFAMATLRADSDPTVALRGALVPPKVTHRPALVDERKLGSLMAAIDEYDGWPTLAAALKFTALTIARPGEVRGAVRGEIDFDRRVWRIPPERTKMRRLHDVPLSRQAIEALEDVWQFSEGGDLIFPSIRTNHRPLSENAMNTALRRMGFAKDEMTAHGFRASASTILNERGFEPHVIEAALGHQDENAVRRAYNRATYWSERVSLLQTWADMLDEFRGLANRSA